MTHGTCRVCGEQLPVFRYSTSPRAVAPWWYVVMHGDEDGGPLCDGSGFPSVEQEAP